MNIIDKEQIHELVGLFYTTPYKTFYVNSIDGKSFTKPTGVFVSLGITTSLKSIESIKDILDNYQGFAAEVVEIKSTKVSGQFLNVISKRDNISQYDMEVIPEKCFNREESLEYFPKTSIEEHKWKALFEKIDASENSWEDKLLQDENGEVRIFHKKVNYRKSQEEDAEYRIGIYVTEV